MLANFDPGALLARSYVVGDDVRVTLRLSRVRDLDALADLFAREGNGLSRIEIARLLRSHPRERLMLCATALIDGRELIVGFGTIGLGRRGMTPTLIVADAARAPGLGGLLHEALVGRAAALNRSRDAA